MRRLSKIIMATGGTISMLAMCCLDSDGMRRVGDDTEREDWRKKICFAQNTR